MPRPTSTAVPGPTPTPTATPEPECATGTYSVGNGLCCPNGTELLPGTQSCVDACSGDEVRDDEGICRTPAQLCPEGQLTLLLQCCPDTQEPNGLGQCAPRCPPNTVRDTGTGNCISLGCPTGQQIDPSTGACVPSITCPTGQEFNPQTGDCELPTTGPTCPSGIIAPADGRCCLAGEAIDAGGFCAPACTGVPGNPIRDFQGICCPTTPITSFGALYNPQTGLCEVIA